MTEALRILRNGRTGEGVKVKWQTWSWDASSNGSSRFTEVKFCACVCVCVCEHMCVCKGDIGVSNWCLLCGLERRRSGGLLCLWNDWPLDQVGESVFFLFRGICVEMENVCLWDEIWVQNPALWFTSWVTWSGGTASLASSFPMVGAAMTPTGW